LYLFDSFVISFLPSLGFFFFFFFFFFRLFECANLQESSENLPDEQHPDHVAKPDHHTPIAKRDPLRQPSASLSHDNTQSQARANQAVARAFHNQRRPMSAGRQPIAENVNTSGMSGAGFNPKQQQQNQPGENNNNTNAASSTVDPNQGESKETSNSNSGAWSMPSVENDPMKKKPRYVRI
jgi:hypothetical protein